MRTGGDVVWSRRLFSPAHFKRHGAERLSPWDVALQHGRMLYACAGWYKQEYSVPASRGCTPRGTPGGFLKKRGNRLEEK